MGCLADVSVKDVLCDEDQSTSFTREVGPHLVVVHRLTSTFFALFVVRVLHNFHLYHFLV